MTATGERVRRQALGLWVLAALLPLVGLVSLLLRSTLDLDWDDHKLHFVVFACVGALTCTLAYVAGEAATRRGDARVLLISLAFLVTGGSLVLHADGTPMILFTDELAGFQVAISVGLLLAATFALGSALVDLRPGIAPAIMRRRRLLRGAVVVAMALWCAWTVARLPPLQHPGSEGASGSLLSAMAIVGVVLYGAAAVRYWFIYRGDMTALPASVIACFMLLSEAMVGVAVTGERNWHASWWEWHALIVLAYVIIGVAVRREWHDERLHVLYLPSTRVRSEEVSVLFSDLVSFTSFSERASADEVAELLSTYYGIAAPLLSRRFGGEVEKFIGDGIVATFNGRGDQPDHARRAAAAGLALQRELERVADEHPGWPRLRVGVNSGEAVRRELGGHGYITYALVGDTVNTGARLESSAPVGGVLIGAETYRRLPENAAVEPIEGLRVDGKESSVDAYVLYDLPS